MKKILVSALFSAFCILIHAQDGIVGILPADTSGDRLLDMEEATISPEMHPADFECSWTPDGRYLTFRTASAMMGMSPENGGQSVLVTLEDINKAAGTRLEAFPAYEWHDKDIFRFEIECGGGTYIRSLARDLAASLGTCAAMSALCRTESGGFKIENSIETRALTRDNINEYLIPTDSVLPYPKITLTPSECRRYLNGLAVNTELEAGQYRVYLAEGSFYGVGVSDGTILKSRLKLC